MITCVNAFSLKKLQKPGNLYYNKLLVEGEIYLPVFRIVLSSNSAYQLSVSDTVPAL